MASGGAGGRGGGGHHMANASGTSGPVSTLPSATYRQTPISSQHQAHTSYSPRPPGSLSPQTLAAAAPPYASPRLSQAGRSGQHNTGSPHSAGAGTSAASQLNRSQSLGHAAYQQYHAPSTHQASLAVSSGSAYPAATMSFQSPRDRASAQYPSDGSGTVGNTPYVTPRSSTGASSALLPTINTQIPSGSFMNMPYSPSSASSAQQAYASESPYQSRAAHTPASGSRPFSMYEQGYSHGAGSSSSAHHVNLAAAGQHASPYAGQSSSQAYQQHPHMSPALPQSTGSVLPTHHSVSSGGGQYSDSLPLYNTASSHPNTSPYGPALSPGKLGAPPRAPPQSSSPYSPRSTDRRLSADPNPLMSDAARRRDRRGTITSADNADYDMWRQQNNAQKPTMPGPPKRLEGFRRVRDLSDLKVNLEPAQQGRGRRADPAGGYVGPLKAMTAYLHHTYHLVNPGFFYELSFNPRRVLTKPSKPMHNDGHDNEDFDYILYVNDWLGSEESSRYLILDILGQGTFGQVVKCQNMKTREIVAVKVIKNKPAYFNQSMMEVTILETLNGSWDPKDEHHILRLRDTFIHAKHLCLVFELLSSNLYELIKQNSFRGLSTSLVRVFTTQLLDALTVLHEARLIHCDLKPENILLKTLQTPSIKLVDFGSACHERQTVYTYIQSRFYRSPEVLLGLPYNAAIDMWSLGCIAVELFLGLPLFPGTSEYNQICRIVEMLGLPPQYMLEQGKQTGEFFNVYTDEYGRKSYKVKSLEQYSKEHHIEEQPSKRYFQATTLPDIVKTYPMSRKSGKPGDVQKEMSNRVSFIDFVSGLLSMDPSQRWTPQQARQHPFITGEKFEGPFQPPVSPVNTITRPSAKPASDANKHPYGGLQETSSRNSGRAYQDAAAYSQHLAQQQAYMTAHQARQQQVNNPYARDDKAQGSHTNDANATATQAQAAHAQAHAQAQAHAAQVHAAISPPYGALVPAPPNAVAAQPSSGSSYTQNRSRSNTRTRMDMVPPQLAKMGLEPTQYASGAPGSTNTSLSPALDVSGSRREWDRGQQQQQQDQGLTYGNALGMSSNRPGKQPQTNGGDFGHPDQLQRGALSPTSPQSAQMGSSPNQGSQQKWSNTTLSRLAQQPTSRTYGQSGSPQPFSVVVDGQQQKSSQNSSTADGAGMRRAGSNGPGQIAANTHVPAPPPAAYPSGSGRYSGGTSGGNSAAVQGLGFDAQQQYDTSQLMPALQPTQYHHGASASPQAGGQRRQSFVGVGAGGGSMQAARHSIAAPPTSLAMAAGLGTGPTGLPGSASLANMRGMYSPSSSGGAGSSGIVPGMLLPSYASPAAASGGAASSGRVASDGYGGLSDMMYGSSGGGGGGGGSHHSALSSTSSHLHPTQAPRSRSPGDNGGLPQYRQQQHASQRY